jgi:hypothetical protein
MADVLLKNQLLNRQLSAWQEAKFFLENQWVTIFKNIVFDCRFNKPNRVFSIVFADALDHL